MVLDHCFRHWDNKKIALIHCYHPLPHIAFSLRMSGNTTQTGKSGFSIYYPRHCLTTPLGQWGYVGKAPPRSSTSSRDSSANSVSRTSLHTPQTFSAASRAPAMPPRARPVSRPIPGPEQPQALSRSSELPLGVSLPTTFRFLRWDTVTPATAASIPVSAKTPIPAMGPESVPVSTSTSEHILMLTIYSSVTLE